LTSAALNQPLPSVSL